MYLIICSSFKDKFLITNITIFASKIQEIKKLFLLFLSYVSQVAFGQSANAVFIDTDIEVDGVANESEWSKSSLILIFGNISLLIR